MQAVSEMDQAGHGTQIHVVEVGATQAELYWDIVSPVRSSLVIG